MAVRLDIAEVPWHTFADADEVMKKLNTSKDGLSIEEVVKRQAE